jgi:pimeloyl-ACP methyl ester carboxylesterase
MYPAPYLIRLGGRALTVEDSGPESGLPVLVHSGGGSRHLFPPAVRDARCEGLRLISYDRPAYGGSTPVPGRVVADCAADVQAIAAELGITRLAVWGFSGGGPYALATAALLPDVVVAVCVFAPLGPYGADGLDFLAGMEDSYREEVRIFFQDRRAAREKFRAEAAEMYQRLSTAEGWLSAWGNQAGKDDAHGPDLAEYLASLMRDGWTCGDEGWWDDWSAFLSPWGFDPAAIQAPVRLWHGLADTRCPPDHSRWLAGRIPHITAHFPEHEDHTNVEENNRAAAFAWLRGFIDSRVRETRAG